MTTTAETVTRLCAFDDCATPLTSPTQRQFCSQAHSSAARRKPVAPARRPNPGLNSAPPPFVPRIENGVWRPNADGWPAQPHIPQRSTS